MNPKHEREEAWIRMLLNEEQDAAEFARIRRELVSSIDDLEQFRQVESVVNEVEAHYQSPTRQWVDLTKTQKEELYAEISSTFASKRAVQRSQWMHQLRFSVGVLLGTVALVASVPFFTWVNHGSRYTPYAVEADYLLTEPSLVSISSPRHKAEPIEEEPIEDEIIWQADPVVFTLPNLELKVDPLLEDMGRPAMDLPSLNFADMIVNLLDTDEPPLPVKRVSPIFPVEARRVRMDGMVVVEFIVDREGSVIQPKVSSSTNVVFEHEALNAIRRWEFRPGEKDGESVNVLMRVPFVFNHRD
jgi:TonB family protein